MKIIILWAIFALLLANSAALFKCKSANAGSLMTYALTICAFFNALFFEQLGVFFSHGIGAVLKYCFLAFALLLLALALVVLLAPPPQRPDGSERVLIVLGAGIVGERITDLLKRRLDAAFTYYEAHPDIIIVTSGGQGPREARPEGDIMREYLIKKGVLQSRIYAETKSTSTEENFAFSLNTLKENNVPADAPLIYTTNGFHCFRAGLYAKKAGIADIRCIPATIGIASVLPCYLREGPALVYYILFKR